MIWEYSVIDLDDGGYFGLLYIGEDGFMIIAESE